MRGCLMEQLIAAMEADEGERRYAQRDLYVGRGSLFLFLCREED